MKSNQIWQINIDPFTNLHYSAFYIEGLQSISTGRITYNRTPFENIKNGRRTCLLFILSNRDQELKIAIDFHDPNSVTKEVLEWSDVYAKINYHHIETLIDIKGKFPEEKICQLHTKKLISIPPSFGIDIFSLSQALSFISKILKDSSLSILDKKQIFAGFFRMKLKRHKLSEYVPKDYKKKYIFHLSSIWAKDTESINISRKNFIMACKSINSVDFEGGLVDIGYPYEYMGDINNIIFLGGKIKLEKYIKKTKESHIVFNGPSVEKCHGWKLAEYLSLGKAIISTSLYNDLPFPLIHGTHIHYVDDNYNSIEEGIKLLLENPQYVDRLQKGAVEYWELYVNPTNVVKRIVEFALENK